MLKRTKKAVRIRELTLEKSTHFMGGSSEASEEHDMQGGRFPVLTAKVVVSLRDFACARRCHEDDGTSRFGGTDCYCRDESFHNSQQKQETLTTHLPTKTRMTLLETPCKLAVGHDCMGSLQRQRKTEKRRQGQLWSQGLRHGQGLEHVFGREAETS